MSGLEFSQVVRAYLINLKFKSKNAKGEFLSTEHVKWSVFV